MAKVSSRDVGNTLEHDYKLNMLKCCRKQSQKKRNKKNARDDVQKNREFVNDLERNANLTNHLCDNNLNYGLKPVNCNTQGMEWMHSTWKDKKIFEHMLRNNGWKTKFSYTREENIDDMNNGKIRKDIRNSIRCLCDNKINYDKTVFCNTQKWGWNLNNLFSAKTIREVKPLDDWMIKR
jgi:hypothetical protein